MRPGWGRTPIDVLRELGLTAEQIAGLKRRGIVAADDS